MLLLAPDSLKRVFVVRSSPSCAISYAAAGLRQVALCMLDVDIWGGGSRRGRLKNTPEIPTHRWARVPGVPEARETSCLGKISRRVRDPGYV